MSIRGATRFAEEPVRRMEAMGCVRLRLVNLARNCRLEDGAELRSAKTLAAADAG
ncbi:MAG: hypothetical protein JNL58_27220 [Planctomyces sp.]|nr:hypothetical protein [Planctomyces sp.]